MTEFVFEAGDQVYDTSSPRHFDMTVLYTAIDGRDKPILSNGRHWMYLENAVLIGPPSRVKQQDLIARGKQ